jgi:hypothetical protein
MASLRAVARFATAAEALDAAREIVDVPAILPRVIADDGGLRIVLPGDAGYGDAAPDNGPGPLAAGQPWPTMAERSRWAVAQERQ